MADDIQKQLGKSYEALLMSTFAGVSAIPSSATPGERDQFDMGELAVVLSHYDLGVILEAQEFPRGSRRSPKLMLRTDKGAYVLKRRAKGRDDPFKVAFSHSLQLHLIRRKFPLPRLVGTRHDNNSMLQHKGCVYEVFEYIQGAGYDNSLEATQDAGLTLGVFHKLLKNFESEYQPSRSSYHASRTVSSALEQLPQAMEKSDPASAMSARNGHIGQLVEFLTGAYSQACQHANETGLDDWPVQITHSDWHPGNLLFKGHRVVAVLDYDSARKQQRVIDTANAALQFSIMGGGDDPTTWPDYADLTRFKRFLMGYDSVEPLNADERKAVPWLMVEALIAEAAIPVAATGSFARIQGFDFLQMIQRKTRWLQQHADMLAGILLSE